MPDLIRKEVIKMRRDGDLEKHEARSFYNDASSIDNEVSAHLNSEVMSVVLGDDWMRRIPDKPTREWRYLMKIIPVVREAFRKELEENETSKAA